MVSTLGMSYCIGMNQYMNQDFMAMMLGVWSTKLGKDT